MIIILIMIIIRIIMIIIIIIIMIIIIKCYPKIWLLITMVFTSFHKNLFLCGVIGSNAYQ